MKVVYNTKGFGLHLNEAEMKMFAALRGYQFRAHPTPLSSSTTWFVDVDWEEFRTDPLLVRLCEQGMLSNEALAVFEWDECDPYFQEEWTIKTDYCTYEMVYVYETDPWELPGYYDEEETTTEGATA